MFINGLVIALGLVTGSFANSVIYRLPREQSIILPNSFCPHCQQSLHFYDLIPIISYINLRGKCRRCKRNISIEYPLVEALMACLFTAVYLRWGLTVFTVGGWLLALFTVCGALIDVKWGVIPDRITYPAIIAGLVLAYPAVGIASAWGGGLFFAGILWLTAFCCPGGMGGGDIKMALAIGLLAGFAGAAIAFLTAVILGALYGLILIITGRANGKTPVKFGPFLALGAFIGYNYSAQLIDIYCGFWL